MEEKDYPNLYLSANDASISTQRWYLNAIKLYLSLLVTSAITNQFAPKHLAWSVFSALILIVTLGLSIYQAFKRFDIIWYNGRAVAESVKTRTWRFIMKTEPYQDDSYEIVAKKFNSDVAEILKENKELCQYLNDQGTGDCITAEMNRIRGLDLIKRRGFYKISRIDEQRKWYAKKAKANRIQSSIWFYSMIGSNLIAVVLALVQIACPKMGSFPIEILIVVASSILTWMQVKRYQELTTSYNLTAHEITIVRQNIDFCLTDTQLSDFVKDAENAFSREHTQWVARKDK